MLHIHLPYWFDSFINFWNSICKSLLRKLNWWYVGKCFMTWKKKKSAGRHIQEEQWWWSWWIFQTWQKWIYKSWHFSQAKCFLNIPFVVSFQKKKWTSLVIYSKLRISIMFIITVTWLIQVIMDIGQVFTRYVISSNTQTFFELFQKILIKLSLSEASY